MRWVPWLLGILGVVQYGVIASVQPTDYVSADMAYLVMWLAVIGALIVCYLSWGCGCCGGWDDGCDCCGEGCECGDGECCMPGKGHEGHGHDGGHAH